MSKRLSAGGSNTLLNYFTRSPSVPKKENTTKVVDNLEDTTPKKNGKRQINETNDNEDNIKPVKRRRQILRDSDSEDENVTDIKKKVKVEKDSDSETENNPEASILSRYKHVKVKTETPDDDKVYVPQKMNTVTPVKVKKEKNKDFIEESNSKDSEDDITWLHEKLKFLKPEYIKDKYGKKKDHPDYDGRTLYVPDDFLSKQTPAMRQWWEMKKDHFDCILFFKVGKFYELYHMDAVVGVNELGFSFMKGDFAHSGFPESAYSKMSSSLVDMGYKVARVEQTETPEAMNDRIKSGGGGGGKNKVVRREICQITSRATRVVGLQDPDIRHPLPSYLLALCEQWSDDKSTVTFGVCFVDSSIGTFHIGQFEDDARYSRLLTLVAEYPPAGILEERKHLSSGTKTILKTVLRDIRIESLVADTQFYSSTKTLKLLSEGEYFKNSSGEINFPVALQIVLDEDDTLNTTSKPEYELAVRSLGACLWYLKSCLLDYRLFTIGKFELYTPSDISSVNNIAANKYLVLDSYSLINLNLLGITGTLQSTLDLCCTAFGKRLLHQHICRPLSNVTEIVKRQKAISELLKRPELIKKAREILATLPDLERNVSRIHALGNLQNAKNHPDSRAILYEEKSYSRRKIHDFIATLNGFEKAADICDVFNDVESELLKDFGRLSPEGKFPSISAVVEYFKNSFNLEEAAKEGRIIPEKGHFDEYDDALAEIESIQQKLDDYLEEQSSFFGCKITYFGTDKKRFQLDVPESKAHKVTRDYFLEGTKKGSKPSKRYTTNETRKFLADMIAAETKRREVLQDLVRSTFEKFSNYNEKWYMVCHCLSVLDVLLSLAEYTRNQSVEMCVPEVLPYDNNPKLIITNGVHPYSQNIESFVPNDTILDDSNNQPGILILTGPNMGGKSTLMRQVAILTIMAQMGCHVPAESMTLTLVDRIFTRLGAHDDIIAKHSTFLIELRESSAILKYATHNSLVFLDELGRGTSTHDGTAVAIAYVDCLLEIQCRTIFSTHYYNLVDYFKHNPHIQLGHMACKVESEEDETNEESVVLMYKMTSGVCPKSFGFNAARLAGVPKLITTRASAISQRLEFETKSRKQFRALFVSENLLKVSKVREILDAIAD